MKLITKLGIATAGIALTVGLAETKPAQALTWNWSFNGGAEAGTFDTNGTFANTSGSFNFVINPATVAVTTSAFAPSLVGATLTETQPTQGFLWNGTNPTQFYRSSGASTNGSNFFSLPDRVTFAILGGTPRGSTQNETTFISNGFSLLTLTPVAATPVPFGFSTNLSLGILGAYTLGNRLLKKAKAAKKPVEL
ncbi:hypothetical protein [Anabaena sp. UHCC 0451]|uniref:PFE-CTERM domain-containing protein n=1 Tax=Anabaena sp. UHCC 0451 TaxID=2055235 RepID=UPI002B201CD6|nr:hypothetical protein [Anabaena sp. UHCC 0451]MEA5575386.1 hypothetical protein [Anabaena sp. UHCC 0451]